MLLAVAVRPTERRVGIGSDLVARPSGGGGTTGEPARDGRAAAAPARTAAERAGPRAEEAPAGGVRQVRGLRCGDPRGAVGGEAGYDAVHAVPAAAGAARRDAAGRVGLGIRPLAPFGRVGATPCE